MKLFLVVYGAGLTYSVHGAFLDEVDANTKCRKEARNHYDPDNWRVLEEELVTGTPGAQPAPSVHVEQDESVRKAWARLRNELHRCPDAPYPGMTEAFEQHFSQSFTDRDWRAESGTWAAAWKAAKRHGTQPAPSAPDGWKLVPIVPTQEMRNAWTDNMHEAFRVSYRAMLNAAPKPEGE